MLIEIILAILAMVLGIVIKLIKDKLGISNEQGDIILSALVDLAKSSGDSEAIAVAETIQKGWNDEKFSTDAMKVLYEELRALLIKKGILD